jgi:hypothetical protein
MPNLPCRLIHNIGTRVSLRLYWDGDCQRKSGSSTYHNAQSPLCDIQLNEKRDIDHLPDHYDASEWPTHCEHCGAAAPVDANRQVSSNLLYNTDSGVPEPGDMYYAAWYHPDGYCHWDNCKHDPRGHLIVVLPNGHTWDLDGRASNCTMKEDKLHRCWVKHGEAPQITVDKNGLTCGAGAGSILVKDYHGFLIDGELREC